MHGLARPIGNRLTPHSSGEVRPQISELARVHRSHGPDREQREQADQEPGQRWPTEEQTRAQRDRRCRNWAAQTPTPAMAGGPHAVVQLKKPIRERGEHERHADEQEAATQKERSKEIILLLTVRSRTARHEPKEGDAGAASTPSGSTGG